ncbi:MAG: hypothetical protein HQL69_01750 [Magnetococcales bacterium]|nr:hypothetical protein [Magnetococcales bacterium]
MLSPTNKLMKGSFLIVGLLLFSGSAYGDELADIKEQIQILMERVEVLEQEKKDQQTAAVAIPKSDKAKNREVKSGNTKVKLSVSGWMDRAVLMADDGNDSNGYFVDGTLPSRFRLTGRASSADGWTIGSNMEWHYRSNAAFIIDQYDQDNGTSDGSFKERVLEVFFNNPKWGKLSLGQGPTASNGIAERDLSGTFVAAYSDTRFLAGGMRFRRADGSLADSDTTNPRVRHSLSNMDGMSLRDRVRYDSPSLAGFKISLGAVQGDVYDTALTYSGDMGAFKVTAAAGASSAAINYLDGKTKDFTQYAGSVSVLFDNGLNMTLAGGTQEAQNSGRNNPGFYYAKLGYKADLFQKGKTNLSVDYHSTDDLMQNGDAGDSYGFQAVQNMDDWGSELYLSLRKYQYSQTGVEFDDITGTLVGARVKF